MYRWKIRLLVWLLPLAVGLVGYGPPSMPSLGIAAIKQPGAATKESSPRTGQRTAERATAERSAFAGTKNRAWTLAGGESRTAAFVSTDDGTVNLRDPNGKQFELQFEK